MIIQGKYEHIDRNVSPWHLFRLFYFRNDKLSQRKFDLLTIITH